MSEPDPHLLKTLKKVVQGVHSVALRKRLAQGEAIPYQDRQGAVYQISVRYSMAIMERNGRVFAACPFVPWG